ncbi:MULTISPECIES: type II toxin-antitoxin system VapB family antitoxin [Brevundimonas]|jgi:antitoxin VapB|uniref:Antitoxin VapB n=1 Tax=Brevundimonas aurantiaca TaxID=74316 RepID=A0A7W9C4J7_9CAUL|nr:MULTISPECIES: type II toxin-antitoxin system VapB family antitoxin [Brevundimonas]EHN77785.1 transcription factor [Streptomyces coelicoflavus ZG0656]MEC7796757.1 type II toxin-antitoxin system VapB family antitoxin [Pseudomonadota bacterium]MZE44371.1 transcription factor [Streptomyces sp. SID5477]MBB5738801.1 antitoxin VapB [Brevundimonas aurantiaca]MED5537318.1 type II toxin-antitoxin system VapB family antitoxin [Pseudomonadota bacterium]
MALYVKDPEVDRMAERLSRIGGISKTEVVRRALRRQLEQVEEPGDLVKRIEAFVSDLQARAPRERGEPIDKAWIDSLYERD